jgi:DNA polymerase III epsilon subunit-like protein
LRWKSLPIVAFDTETTGLEPFGGDRVIEFAAVVLHLDEQGQVCDREDHAHLINPGIPIPRKVTEITGISDSDVVGAPAFQEVADSIHGLLVNAVTVAHNYPFDLAFLTMAFRDAGMHWPEPMAEVDTVDLSMICFPDARSHRLGDVADRLGITFDGAHRATNDAAACGMAFAALARRHEVDDELQAMLDWAKAIGRPPLDGPLATNDHGAVVFSEGPHKGQPVAEQPIHLAWIEKARLRGPRGWQWRYPESSRRWVRRWLEVRGSGRARQTQKSIHHNDWALDPCIATPRRRAKRERATL